MSLSLGGGSIINALMGQAGNVGQQRQRQQDQLMQMMMQGFVPNEASQQEAQGKGLLSQLVGPTGVLPLQSPKPMRPGDFEMAPWNPAEVSREEREARKAEADKKRTHDINVLNIQNEDARALAEDQKNWDIDVFNMETERDDLSRQTDYEYKIALAKAEDDDARKRIEQQHRLELAAIDAEYEKKKILASQKLKDSKVYDAKDYVTLVQSLTEINAAIETADEFFMSPTERKTYDSLVKVRNEIMAILDEKTQGGAAGAVDKLTDALSGKANEVTTPREERQQTHTRGFGTR